MEKRVPYISILTAFGVLISFQLLVRGVVGPGALIFWAIGIGLTFLGEFLGSKMKFRYGANVGAAIPAILLIVLSEVLTAHLDEIWKASPRYPIFPYPQNIFRYAQEVPAVCALIANVLSLVTDRVLIYREHHGEPPESFRLKPFLPMLITSGACSFGYTLLSYIEFILLPYYDGLPFPGTYIEQLARIVCLAALVLGVGKWLDKLTGRKIIGYALVAAAGAFRVFANFSYLKDGKRDPASAGALPFYRFDIIVWAALVIAAGVLIYRALPGADEPVSPDASNEAEQSAALNTSDSTDDYSE